MHKAPGPALERRMGRGRPTLTLTKGQAMPDPTHTSGTPTAMPPGLTGPSYTGQILRAAAEQLDRDPRQILTDARWRGTFALAAARTIAHHPTPVADNAAEVAWYAAPTDAAGHTHRAYAVLLRAAAQRADHETARLQQIAEAV